MVTLPLASASLAAPSSTVRSRSASDFGIITSNSSSFSSSDFSILSVTFPRLSPTFPRRCWLSSRSVSTCRFRSCSLTLSLRSFFQPVRNPPSPAPSESAPSEAASRPAIAWEIFWASSSCERSPLAACFWSSSSICLMLSIDDCMKLSIAVSIVAASCALAAIRRAVDGERESDLARA